MAYRNQLIRCSQTGHEITVLHPAKHTEGRFLGLMITFKPRQASPVPYYHPHQSVDFDVLKGRLTVQLGKEVVTLQVGDRMQIPVGQMYRLWNHSEEPASLNCRIRPALDTEQLLETLTELSASNPMPQSRWGTWLQYVLIARKFAHVFRQAHVPPVAQQLEFIIAAPVAHWLTNQAIIVDTLRTLYRRVSNRFRFNYLLSSKPIINGGTSGSPL